MLSDTGALGKRRAEGGGSAWGKEDGGRAGTRRVRGTPSRLPALVLAVAAFLLAGPGAGPVAAAPVASVSRHGEPAGAPDSVGAFALCSGRHLKTVGFATGEVRVYRNRQSACAVTVAKRPGARRAMVVSIQARGGRAVVEKGPFRRQAGPVSVFALNRCVRASGSVAGVGRSTGWISC